MEGAKKIASGHETPTAIAKACFEWVRDEIHHSYDYQMSPVTCRASDVLQHKTGYCYYAKSHLLVALLRANEIPVTEDTAMPFPYPKIIVALEENSELSCSRKM